MLYQDFRDFDEFAAAVRDIDSTMMLQNPEQLFWSVCQVNLGGLDVQQGKLGSGNIVEGQSWSDGYLLYLPLTNKVKYLANGKVVDKTSFMIMEPGCEFSISTRVAHDWCSLFVPTHKLARVGALIEPSSGSGKMTCRVTRPNPQVANQFWALVRQTMTAAHNCPQFESSPAAYVTAAELCQVASLVLGHRQAGEPNREGRPRVPRQEIIRRFKELLEERDGKPLLVGELAAASGVCERTLRTAFNEYFGVGPFRYLQLRQLHQVHHALKAAAPEERTVTDVLVAHGVWEFGRFASQYRRLFGELPSETLRSKHKCLLKLVS